MQKGNNIQVQIEEIGPIKAQEYLDKNLHNRRISQESLLYYTDQMLRGQWVLSPEGIAFDNVGQLLDGQHRLMAIIKSNTTQKFMVSRGFGRETFKVINTGKNRNAADLFSIEDIKNASLIATGIRKFSLLSKGINTRESNKRSKVSNTDFLEIYEQNPELFQLLSTTANALYARLRIITNGDIFGYMAWLIITKKKTYDDVYQYFNELTSFSNNHAINEFRNKLIKARVSPSFKITDLHRHVYIVKSWNSFISGNAIKTITFYSDKEAVPEVV